MRLVTFSHGGQRRPGVVVNDDVVALGAGEPRSIRQLLDAGEDGLELARRSAKRVRLRFPLSEVRLEAPVVPRKLFIVGPNYRSLPVSIAAAGDTEVGLARRESRQMSYTIDIGGMKRSGHPFVTSKATSSICGPFETIVIDDDSVGRVLYENELAIVVGTRCRNVTVADVPRVCVGYMICNDVTSFDLAAVSPTYTLAKSFDTFAPTGPWIVTSDEIPDPQSLSMRVTLSGQLDQVGTTADMEATCGELVGYLSRYVTLEPGDVIATGFPATPSRFLRDGDVVRCEIESIGSIENRVTIAPQLNVADPEAGRAAF